MFIYENEEGDLYLSEIQQTSDVQYAETEEEPGIFVGEAQNAQDAWELLKPAIEQQNEKKCNACSVEEGSEKCLQCKNNQEAGGYTLPYVMNLLEPFAEEEKKKRIYIVLIDPETGKVGTWLRKSQDEYDELPSCFCMSTKTGEKAADAITEAILLYFDDFVIKKEKKEMIKMRLTAETALAYVFFVSLKDDGGVYRYVDDGTQGGWFGFSKSQDFCLSKQQKKILDKTINQLLSAKTRICVDVA